MKKIGTLMIVALAFGAVATEARAQFDSPFAGREEVTYQAFFPSDKIKGYLGNGPLNGISWTHRLTQPPSVGLGRTLFVDWATTGGQNTRNFLAGGLGVQSKAQLGTEGTTLNLGGGVGWYGTFGNNTTFDPGRKNGPLARVTAGLHITGNFIIEGAYFRSLRAGDGVEGTGLKVGFKF
jgi:hypothetical protein